MISTICADYLQNSSVESYKDGICKTSGAIFHTHISEDAITVRVNLPKNIKSPESKKDAIALEHDLHDAIESVLARLF